jgi:23S rRNA pseudoU1915 N3-methylase RlmH
MKFRIIWTGKTRDARLRALIDDYAERLSHFVRCEVTELRELGRTDKAGIDKEGRRISDALCAIGCQHRRTQPVDATSRSRTARRH